MLILSSTTDKLEVVTTLPTATLDYLTNRAKLDLSVNPPVVNDADTKTGVITGASAGTDITGSPASATDRWEIGIITLRNTHATLPADPLLRYVKAGGTARELFKVILQAQEMLVRDKAGVWFKYDSTGAVKTALAIPSTRVVLASGTAATYTTPAGCRAIDVDVIAGGGAGGGSSSVAASGGAGGGGGSGGITRKLIASPSSTYTYTVGAGGTAGAAGANAGNAGADSTFGTLTAKGGAGGAGCTAAAATRALGGAGGIAGSGGDINGPGEPGRTGVVMTAALVASGAGGPSEAGGGAPGVIAQGAGTAAANNSGGGGSGGASVSAGAAVAGGAGGSGVIIVTEYY